MNSAPALRTVSLCAGYPSLSDETVLREIALELKAGQLVGLVGPNGSGKSTLMRALSRTLKPTRGAVLLDERDLYRETSAREAALRIGVVPQDTSVAFDFSVREVVAMGRAPHQLALWTPAAETAADIAAIERALEQADLGPEFFERPVSTLSGGERQRVLIARAVAQDAEILLLDEPTSALDLRHEEELLAWLRRLAGDEGRTVFVALHDLNLAARHADRVIVLSDGRIASDGPANEALSESTVEEVYGVRVRSQCDALTGRPYFLIRSVAGQGRDSRLSGKRVHVIGGAGTSRPLIHALTAAGADPSVGAVHGGDLDILAAEGLPDERRVVADPFVPFGRVEIDAVVRMGSKAELLIVAPAPFGPMNLGNLEAAMEVANKGTATLLSRGASAACVEAQDLLSRLRSLEAVRVVDHAIVEIGCAGGNGNSERLP